MTTVARDPAVERALFEVIVRRLPVGVAGWGLAGEVFASCLTEWAGRVATPHELRALTESLRDATPIDRMYWRGPAPLKMPEEDDR